MEALRAGQSESISSSIIQAKTRPALAKENNNK